MSLASYLRVGGGNGSARTPRAGDGGDAKQTRSHESPLTDLVSRNHGSGAGGGGGDEGQHRVQISDSIVHFSRLYPPSSLKTQLRFQQEILLQSSTVNGAFITNLLIIQQNYETKNKKNKYPHCFWRTEEVQPCEADPMGNDISCGHQTNTVINFIVVHLTE